MSDLKQFNAMIVRPNTQEYLMSVLNTKKDQFVNDLTALVANDTNLQACEPVTIMYAAIKATALSLPLDKNLGFAYVIPYNNGKKGISEAQFQMGYKGYIQLAIRSGQFKNINVTDIREGEIKRNNLLTGEIEFEMMPNRSELPIVGYAAFFALNNGFSKTLYMTKDEVQRHAKRYSQTYSSSKDYIRNSSKWTTDFDAMAKKTVLKLLLSKYAPLSVEMQQAVKFDQSVMYDPDKPEYRDNETKTATEEADELMAEDANWDDVPVSEVTDVEEPKLDLK